MKKKTEIRHKSVLPLYGAGIVFVLTALMFPIYRLWALVTAAVCTLAAFIVLSRICPDRVEQIEEVVSSGDAQADQLIELIAENRLQLKEINDRIPDDVLSAEILRMERCCDSILEVLQKQPKQAMELRRFAKYYLPDAVKILDLYAELDEQGVKGENAAEVRREVEQNAQIIANAFEKQLDSLYEVRAMDISTDLDVLKGMLNGQGLA